MPTKKYLINRSQNRKFRVDGLVPSEDLPTQENLCQAFSDHAVYNSEQLPPKTDLRPQMTPIEDQSRIGSCSANCLAGAYEYLTKKKDGRDVDVSRLFIYYNGRYKQGNSPYMYDSGCSMTAAIQALQEIGVCLENFWPYDISQVNMRPTDYAYQAAQSHKIIEALRINIDLNEMKTCLAQGYPFAFGLKLFSSFDQASTTGVVPTPNFYDAARPAHGSHALLAVGYSDQSQSFVVRNSWGQNWGDKGYCYIQYDYMTNPNYCFDAWTIRRVAQDNFDQNHWDRNDSYDYRQYAYQFFGGNDNQDGDNDASIEEIDEEDGVETDE